MADNRNYNPEFMEYLSAVLNLASSAITALLAKDSYMESLLNPGKANENADADDFAKAALPAQAANDETDTKIYTPKRGL